jgi:fumarate hydratase class II
MSEVRREREAALKLSYVTADEFDQWVRPEAMTGSSVE